MTTPPVHAPTRSETVRAWVRRRAAADGQMQEAAARRRTANPGDQTDAESGGDVVTVLTRDHDRFSSWSEELSSLPGHRKGGAATKLERRRSLVDQIAAELPAHDAAEQQVLWPFVERVLGEGSAALAETGRAQEQGLATLLADLTATDVDSDEFDDGAEQLVQQLRRHIAFEERVLLALVEATTRDERDRLGAEIRASRGTQR